MVTPAKTLQLIPPKAPNLPIGPVQYTQQYQDQVLNALRLYFNQIDNLGYGLTGTLGGSYLYFPYIAAYDTASQYAAADNTPIIVQWDSLGGGSGFTLNTNSTATASQTGWYKITYSLQLVNSATASEHTAYVWLKTDGTLAPRSTTAFTIPKATSVDSYVCAYSEVVFNINENEKIWLYWATDLAATSGGTKGVYIYAEAAQTSPYIRPAIPSAIGSITFVSALST